MFGPDIEIDRVVLGRQQMGDFLHELASAAPFDWPVSEQWSLDGEYRVLGYRVQFVPWMDGCLCIPKMKETSK